MTEIRMRDADSHRITLEAYRDDPNGRHEVIMTIADAKGQNVNTFRLNPHTAGILISSIRTAMMAATTLDFTDEP